MFATLPFGFKANAYMYIYQSVGMVATGYCRSLGIPLLQYIDDRFVGESKLDRMEKGLVRADIAIYAVCQILNRLRYKEVYFYSLSVCLGGRKGIFKLFLLQTHQIINGMLRLYCREIVLKWVIFEIGTISVPFILRRLML